MCAALRDAMNQAMSTSTHRGGYCLLYPDAPQAQEAVGSQAAQLFSQVSL